jgi:hypothetical protein
MVSAHADTLWIEVIHSPPRLRLRGGDEGRYHGVVQATGKGVDAQVMHVWGIADSRVVTFQQHTDTRQSAQATGETPVA